MGEKGKWSRESLSKLIVVQSRRGKLVAIFFKK
jgi:hypothetical protein